MCLCSTATRLLSTSVFPSTDNEKIIPHISIISGLLLAANNPNIFCAIASETKEEYDNEPEEYHFLEPTYKGAFKVPSLWSRGTNKLSWLKIFCWKHPTKLVEDVIQLSFSTWFTIVIMSLFLIVVPFILSFLVTFFTPEVGVSCRSGTFLLHFATQLTQCVLWFWAYAHIIVNGQKVRGSALGKHGFYNPTSLNLNCDGGSMLRDIWHLAKERPINLLFSIAWYLLAILSGMLAVCCVIGGTSMQLMGVYTADICQLTTSYWFGNPVENAPPVVLSVNTSAAIAAADRWWVPCGIFGTVFIGVSAFVGWWYQRRLRNRFRWLVDNIFRSKAPHVNSTVH